MIRTTSLLLAACLLLPVQTFASTPISETRPAQPDVHVRIENIAGSVRVSVGDDDKVAVTGTLGAGNKPLRFEGDRRRLSIQVEPENEGRGRTRNVGRSDLQVRVPRSARIEVKTVSAGVEVEGVDGSQIEVESVSGNVRYQGDSPRVQLKTVSGDVDGEGAGQSWSVGTVSGRVRLPRSGGELRVESVSGHIEVNFSRADRVRAETVSGRIQAEGELASGGALTMQSVSGTVQLELAGEVDARIQGKTFSGGIDSDFGHPERSGIGGGYRLDTEVGGGTADVRLESFSGRLTIRRGNSTSGR